MPFPSFQFYQVTSGSDRPCFCPADKSRTFPEKHSFRVRRQRQETSANDNCHSDSGRSAFHETRTFTADTHQIYASSDATISAASISMHIL